MADAFQPKFVDLVRNTTTTTGTTDFLLGPAVNGYNSFINACAAGDRFYYSAIGLDRPSEREVGRGTLLAGGIVSRDPVSGTKTNFSNGTKSIALIAAAQWFSDVQSAAAAAPSVAATRAALAASANRQSPVLLSEAGREGLFTFETGDQSAAIALDPEQALHIAPASDPSGSSGAWVRRYSGPLDARWTGAAGDGVSDDTAAIAAALALADDVYLPAGTFVASSIAIPPNKRVRTAGFDTVVRQKPGTGAMTPIIAIGGPNIRIDDIRVEGQLGAAGDTTGEWNAGISIQASASTGAITNIALGGVIGTNIRGDVITIAQSPGHEVSGVTIGQVEGVNVYRNLVSIVGGSAIDIAGIAGSSVGYLHFDIEPDVGAGPVHGVRVGSIRGRFVSIAGSTAGDHADGVEIGYLDLDPSHTGGSSVDFAAGASLTSGLQVRNCKRLHVEKARISGFDGPGVRHMYNAGELDRQAISFGELEISDCSRTDASYYGFVSGSPGVTRLNIGTLKTAPTAGKAAILTCDFANVGAVEVPANDAASQGVFRSCANLTCGNMNHSGAGVLFFACDNLVAVNGKVAASAATLASFSSNVTLSGYAANVSNAFNGCTNTLVLGSTINGTHAHLSVDGVAMLGARQPAVAAPGGGATVDMEARTAISEILGRLQNLGLVASG